nr:MAG TPA: hypothetical protein [Caudoviricetes sp.]
MKRTERLIRRADIEMNCRRVATVGKEKGWK